MKPAPFLAALVPTVWLLASLVAGSAVGAEGRFRPLFDGKTLEGWQGDPGYWSVRDGAIVGQITADTRIQQNRFLIYQRDLPANFDLRAEYRISAAGNSGINYRSSQVPDVDFHALAGYQCDLDGALNYTGSNYEERGRTTLARVGESVVISSGDAGRVDANAWTNRSVQKKLLSTDELKSLVHAKDWNKVRVVAQGNVLEHYLNDVLVSRVVDKDEKHRRLDGKLGVQVHVGPPMTIEFRRIKVRPLDSPAL